MTEHFDAEWLTLREPFDHAARSVALARRLADRLPRRPRLLDLGAGTGSLFRFLAPIIGRGQDWVLIDSDATLLEEAFGRTAAWARRQGFAATAPGDALLVSTPHGLWRMQAVQRDLTALQEKSEELSPSPRGRGLRGGGTWHEANVTTLPFDGATLPPNPLPKGEGENVRRCSVVQRAARSGFIRVARTFVRHAARPVLRHHDGGWPRRLAACSSIRRTRSFGVPARPAARQGSWAGTRHLRAVRRAEGTVRSAASRRRRLQQIGVCRAQPCRCSVR